MNEGNSDFNFRKGRKMKNYINDCGIHYNNIRYALNLLDACIAWECIAYARKVTGGTIHSYLPRLTWVYRGNVARQGHTWHLMLDNEIDIGWYAGSKDQLPEIEPGFMPGMLNSIPVNCAYGTDVSSLRPERV